MLLPNSICFPLTCATAARVGVLALALLPLLATAGFEKRWFFAMGGVSSEKDASRVCALIERAAASGYNGLVLSCDLERWRSWDEPRRARLSRIQETAVKSGIELIPALWSVGYGGWHREYAAAKPVCGGEFRLHGGKPMPIPGGEVALPNGGFEADCEPGKAIPGWLFCDLPGKVAVIDRTVRHGGRSSLRMENFRAHEYRNGRCAIELNLESNKMYRLEFFARTEDLKPSGLRAMVLAEDGTTIASCEPRLKPASDWTPCRLRFDTVRNSRVRVYLGIWGGGEGRFWLDDVRLFDEGAPEPLIREGLPFVVTGTNADGCVTADYHTQVIVANDQHPCCMSAPELYRHYRNSAEDIARVLRPKRWFLSMDEIRGGGTCALCRARGVDMATQLADCLSRQREIIRSVCPDAEILVWSDMLDPGHNARADYYACPSSFAGVWEKMPRDLTIVCWHGGRKRESLSFFSERGFPTLAAAYYDADDLAGSRDWLEVCRKTPGCEGLMYTTWESKYELLEPFVKMLASDQADFVLRGFAAFSAS